MTTSTINSSSNGNTINTAKGINMNIEAKAIATSAAAAKAYTPRSDEEKAARRNRRAAAKAAKINDFMTIDPSTLVEVVANADTTIKTKTVNNDADGNFINVTIEKTDGSIEVRTTGTATSVYEVENADTTTSTVDFEYNTVSVEIIEAPKSTIEIADGFKVTTTTNIVKTSTTIRPAVRKSTRAVAIFTGYGKVVRLALGKGATFRTVIHDIEGYWQNK